MHGTVVLLLETVVPRPYVASGTLGTLQADVCECHKELQPQKLAEPTAKPVWTLRHTKEQRKGSGGKNPTNMSSNRN